MLGLILIALGTGGIKPCVAAFGGDQFQEHQVRYVLTSPLAYAIFLALLSNSLLFCVVTESPTQHFLLSVLFVH